MYFQASNYKDKHFLDLDNHDQTIAPTYSNRGVWLKHTGQSNLLMVRITYLITNHAPIDKYRQWFFPSELCICSCNKAPVEIRHYILYECKRHKQSWNPL